ncbi:MAG: hypothetical protein KBC81_00050 [Candidatus Pacebacteria bacterium]|nr:hypothetical protein [Candidatus Paceibacterota bacterium]
MNIHPISVHFPVALLTLYSVFELIRFKKLNESSEWFYIKAVFLFVGMIGAFFSLVTGDWAGELYRGIGQLVHAHEFYMQATVFVYGLSTINYLIVCADKLYGKKLLYVFGKLWTLKLKGVRFVFKNWVLVLVALLGLMLLVIGGALGGAIAYGPYADPLTIPILKLLNIPY